VGFGLINGSDIKLRSSSLIYVGLENFQATKGTKTSYSVLVKCLQEESHNVDLKALVMTFLNAIINSFDVLEERVFHRQNLLDTDFLKVVKVSFP